MLDKKALIILQKIVDESDGISPVVLDKAELISIMPDKTSEGDLDGLIELLSVSQLVKVKYSDKENVCLQILPKGKVALSESDKKFESVGQIKVDLNYKRIAVISFSGSFIGAIFGGGMIALIVWLLRTFL